MSLFGRKKTKQRSPTNNGPRRMRDDVIKESSAFQLNRTISSFRKQQDEVSERSIHHKRQDLQKAFLQRIGMILAALVVLILLSFQLSLVISIQTPDTASGQQAATYKKILIDYYASRPAERFKPFLNQDALHQYFLSHAPEVKTVRIETFGAGMATAKLTFRQPLAQWSSGEKTYFVDESGVTFERNYFAPPKLTVKDQSGAPLSGGQEVVNQRFLSFLGQAVSQFAKNNLSVSEIVLPQDTVRQVLFLIEGKGYAVKMTVDRAAAAQVEQAIKAMRFIDERRLRPEYLDVRVDQRVFYK